MAEKKIFNFLDILVIITKWKKLLGIFLFIVLITSYLMIYFFVEEAYDAKVTIIPSEDKNMSGFASLLKNMKSLPIEVGGTFQNKEMELYNTLIYSRTILEEVVAKFDLVRVYKLDSKEIDYMERAIKKLKSDIDAKETNDNAYEIKVRANSPNNASDIANYLVELLNEKIINLKVVKSRDNRIFLEKRLNEVRTILSNSEDSLKYYQEQSKMFDVKDQVKEIVGAYSLLETSLITKQIEQSILENILPQDSPHLNEIKITVSEYQKKLDKIRSEGQPNSMLLPLKTLPNKTLSYLRLYRNIEINSAILEFILPLYEQSKFEEQKDIPVLQVVDYAIPPAKKSYPPRTLFTLIISAGFFLLALFYVLIKENKFFEQSEQILYIRNNLFKWK